MVQDKPKPEPASDEAQEIWNDQAKQFALLDKLASLSPAEYDRQREASARDLGIRKSTLDAEVKALREALQKEEAVEAEKQRLDFLQPIEPWPDPVDGPTTMADLVQAFNDYCVLPEHADVAAALWAIHAHAHDAFDISPFLAFTSPVHGCGKTTALEIMHRLLPRAIRADNVTMAAIFRLVDSWYPTLLLDEADTYLKRNEELRGVLDSGHRKGGYFPRCVGDSHEVHMYKTWAPKVVGLIGRLPPTLEDRSITIEMQRKFPRQRIKRLRSSSNPFADLRSQTTRWVEDHMEELRHTRPESPRELRDRARDNWEPLFAIADLLGDEWPERARTAALDLESDQGREEAYPIMLLEDIRQFLQVHKRVEAFTSERLIEWLKTLEHRPWGEYGASQKPITAHAVARLLSQFKIVPPNKPRVVVNGAKVRGYARAWFEDSFKRYLTRA